MKMNKTKISILLTCIFFLPFIVFHFGDKTTILHVIVGILAGLAGVILWVWLTIDAIKASRVNKYFLLWAIFFFFFGPFGAILYLPIVFWRR